MKKVLAVTLNLQSCRHCCWPMASAHPSSPACGEERTPNFTRAFCAGTRSALPSASQRERKVSRSLGTRHPRQGTSPLRRCPGPAWDRPRSPTSRRGQRHLRAPRRDGTGHGAAQQQEEAPHGSGARAAERWSREGMNGWTHARTDARRRRRRFYRVAPWAGPARRSHWSRLP